MKRGHKWRPAVWGVLGDDVCSRWRCTSRRINPMVLPPLEWDRARGLDTDACLCLVENGRIVRVDDLCPLHSNRPGVR